MLAKLRLTKKGLIGGDTLLSWILWAIFFAIAAAAITLIILKKIT